MNTNRGSLSYCHPGIYGLLLLIEAARRVRRETGARQVAARDLALAHGTGGVLSLQGTMIPGGAATM